MRLPLVLLLVLTACVPGARDDAALTTPPSATAGARTGGTIRVGVTPPDGIDPTGAHEPVGELITTTMCDRLIVLDPTTGEPRPGLATWRFGEDGRSLFLKIRSGARFTDGTALTADDIRFTLSRLADEAFASPSASLVERINGYHWVHGDAETNDDSVRRSLLGVSIVDTKTVSITLFRPTSDFLRVLTHPATAPISRAAALASPVDVTTNPVCAGPYKPAAAFDPAKPFVLKRIPGAPGFDPSLTRAGRGYADTIEFYFYATRAKAEAAQRKGDVDIAIGTPGKRSRPGREVTSSASQIEFIGFGTTAAPFDDPRVRRALSLALDRTAIAGPSSRPGSGFVAESIAPRAPEVCARNTPATGNLAAARKLLKESGATIDTTLTFNDEFDNRATVEAVAKQWRTGLGAKIKLVPMTWEKFRSAAIRPQGLSGAFRFSWAPPYPSVEQVLEPLFTTGGIGKDNWSLYSSRDLDDALRDANEAPDDATREQNEVRALKIVCEDMPMIPLTQAARTWLFTDTIGAAGERDIHSVTADALLREMFTRA